MTRKHLTIPECRGILMEIARDLTINGLTKQARQVRYVIGHMKRRHPVRTTPVKNSPVTPAQRSRIRRLAQTTDMSQMEIGLTVGVNSGRVSEALAGKRR